MKFRGRSRGWLPAVAFAALAGAASAQIQPGREFYRIDPSRAAAADGRIEVIEFFYYGCPVCYETQPRGVPTFVVDGKFLTSARLAGGTNQVIEVIDHLVRLAREERLR